MEFGVILHNEEEDIMAILQVQNEEIANRKRLAKQKEKTRRSRPKKCNKVPFYFMGDFNEIMQVEEEKGASGLPVSAEGFKFWIQDMRLLDLPLNDHHCPLNVEDTRMKRGPRPFRSLDAWFTHEGFLRMVKEKWRNLGDVQLTSKLKAPMAPLRRWHRNNFGDMDSRIKRFEDEIKKIDDMKEIHWKQMSRSRYAKDMDKNTRYFHQVASAKRRNNRIDDALLLHGKLVRNQARIKVAIKGFYKDLYRQEYAPLIGF
ncbi:uncharacterized protein [Arachis hypogaea]|uniref:uncharacterized protein n=1 Tax=Arachis hypogaea TaxID=3818 RepID=UPI003B2223BF